MTTRALSYQVDRRAFCRAGFLGAATMATGLRSVLSAASEKSGSSHGVGLKLGLTTYTLRKFSLDQAIAFTREAGVKYISLKDMHLPLKSSPEERREAARKIAAAGLVLMGGGVIYLKKDQAEVRNWFEYAKDAGIPTIICSPDIDALDLVEKFAKEYELRIAIHNHGPGDKKYPSPRDVMRLVKDRDPRMGICMDVGHTVRIGEDPVAVIQECAGRLYDFHMKDVNEASARGHGVEVGRGIIDIVGVVRTLVKVQYSYNVALEYEENENAPVPGMRESFGFLRGVLATI